MYYSRSVSIFWCLINTVYIKRFFLLIYYKYSLLTNLNKQTEISRIETLNIIPTIDLWICYFKCTYSLQLLVYKVYSYYKQFKLMSFIWFTETAMGVSIDALSQPNSEYVKAVKE